jgi:hypothetical protein
VRETYYRLMTDADLSEVLNMQLRPEDKEELKASTGLEPREALSLSIANSKITWVVIHKEKIAAIFGLGESQLSNVGVPWLLATEQFTEFSFKFARHCREVFKVMKSYYPILINYVYSLNSQTIQWLVWLGFRINVRNPIYTPFSPHAFYLFYMNTNEKGGYKKDVYSCLDWNRISCPSWC